MTSVTQYDLAAWVQSHGMKSKDTARVNVRGESVTPIACMTQQGRVFDELQKTFPYTRGGGYVRGLHPAIKALLLPVKHMTVKHYGATKSYDILVNTWQAQCIITLALEQPSIPVDGNLQRVSYWRSDEHVKQGKRTTVTLGKYLKRHFPQMPDHEIRDFVALYAPIRYEFWSTTEQIIKACEEGPASCMQWGSKHKGPLVDHPYQVYTPELGWKICVGIKNDEIISRALIYNNIFVRSYEKDEEDPGKIGTSHEMTAWLKAQGYEKMESWPEGTRFAVIEPSRINSPYIFPYLDGSNTRVSMNAGSFEIDCYGKYSCTYDDGTADNGEQCSECGDYVDEDDLMQVGQDPDDYTCVCSGCLREHYTWAIGRNGEQAYFKDNRVTEIGGVYYADEFIGDNGLVLMENGEYAQEDQVVYVQYDGYYHVDCIGDNPDSDAWSICEIDGEYYQREDCGYCHYSLEWKLKEDITEIEFDDKTYTVEKGWEDELIDELFHEQARKAGQTEMEFA